MRTKVRNPALVFLQTFYKSPVFGVWIARRYAPLNDGKGHVCFTTTKATNGRHYKVKLS